MSMNLYHVHYDGEPYYVEAASLAQAVAAWRRHMKLFGNHYDGTEEPDCIALVHDAAVIR